MAKTYTKLIYHIVFSTKERAPLITEEIRDRLYPYLGGVIRGEKGSLMEIGGVADHVHLLARFGAAIAVSDMVQRIKGNSSHWLNQQPGFWFAWQNGYGAFTVSESQMSAGPEVHPTSGGASQTGVFQGRAHLPPAQTSNRFRRKRDSRLDPPSPLKGSGMMGASATPG